MKKLILFFFIISVFCFADDKAILGNWITEKAENGNQIIVEIYKTANGKYNGKIKELTIPTYTDGKFAGQEKMDLANQNPELRSRKLVGIDFISDFDYSEKDDKFINGKIYNPENGKTYNSFMKIEKNGDLIVKGSIDKKGLIGKKQIWKRY